MAKPLITWGMSFGRTRSIVATTSKTAAAKAFGISMYLFNLYASDTGNAAEIELATSEPGQVFARSNGGYGRPWEKADGHYA